MRTTAPVRAPARRESTHVPRDGAGRQRVEEVVVRAIVPDTEDELRRLPTVREHRTDVDALVDAARADLAHPLPEQDLRRSTRQVLPEVVQELVRAPAARL